MTDQSVSITRQRRIEHDIDAKSHDKKLNVVMLLTNPYSPDPRVQKEARSLVAAGHRVTVICWDRKGDYPREEFIDGFRVVRVVIQSGYSLGTQQVRYLPLFWRTAYRLIRQLGPDIVHCHDLDTAPVGYWYGRRHRLPWIFDAHECYPEQIGPQVNSLIFRLLLLLERFITKRATHTLTVGELLAARLRALGGRVSVVGNYQAVSETGGSEIPAAITRSDLGLDPTDFVITYVGGFTPARAIIPFIRAASLSPDTTFLLAGDGPQKNAVELEARTFPNVRYLGWIPSAHVLPLMAISNVVYYGLLADQGNSHYSAPNALFNALAVGKPIITTALGEIALIVRNESCGIVIDQPDPRQIAAAIEQMQIEKTAERLAANARQLARTKYNWSEAETTLFQVFEDLAS